LVCIIILKSNILVCIIILMSKPWIVGEQTCEMSIKSCSSTVTEATTDSAMFAEDRSDKSQYVANPVMRQIEVATAAMAVDEGKSAKPAAATAQTPAATASRLDNYRLQVSN
jgi:hypothetical protein